MDTKKTDGQKELTPEQHHILREKGTEPPFSGKYHDNKEVGMYQCAGCGTQLFSSDTKFDSGTGWPSFDTALPGAVEYHEDESHGPPSQGSGRASMKRTEVTCAACGGHLGHVFEDGPTGNLPDGRRATGRRYCINSCALDFEQEES